MKRIAFIFGLCLLAISVFPQSGQQSGNNSGFGSSLTGIGSLNRSIIDNLIHNIDKNSRLSPEELEKELLESIVGTPFMDNVFRKGEIRMVSGDVYKNVLLRYNIFNDIMEASAEGKRYELSKELVKSVELGEKQFEYLPFRIGKTEGSGYLELLKEDRIKLYCHYSKKFKESEPQKALESAPKPPEFVNQPTQFLLLKEGDTMAIGVKNKKMLVEYFSDHQNEISAFVKDHKIKYNNPEDLKKLLSFYNSL